MIETSVIAQLNNPNLNRARQAAETLSTYGDDKAEAAIWARLRRFHEQWANRENDLRYRPGTPRDGNEAIGFQSGLVQSLGRAQGWLLSNQQVDELANLAFGYDHDYAKRYRWDSPVKLNLNLSFDDQLQASIGNQYSTANIASLCAKLKQYPSGTEFKLTTNGEQGRLEPRVQAIRQTATESGLAIETADVQ